MGSGPLARLAAFVYFSLESAGFVAFAIIVAAELIVALRQLNKIIPFRGGVQGHSASGLNPVSSENGGTPPPVPGPRSAACLVAAGFLASHLRCLLQKQIRTNRSRNWHRRGSDNGAHNDYL